MALVLLFLAGLFLGGVITFVRAKQWVAVALCSVAVVMSFAGAIAWW